VRYIRSVVHRITLQTFGAPYGEYRFVYTMHSHPLKHLLFNVSQPTPSTSPNRLHSMSARLTLTVVVAGRRSSCPARAWTWPGCLCPSRRRRPHTRRLPAVRETPRSAEMFNVQAVQLRRHALTAAASLARDCTLLHPEAFLCVARTRTGRYTASCLQRLNPSALPHATPYDTRALTL
jgi:hypothetical protein